MSKKSSSQARTPATPMTQSAASRVQGAVAKRNDGRVPADSFAARAQAAATRNADGKK